MRSVLPLIVLLVAAPAQAERPARVTWQPAMPQQGDALLIQVVPKVPVDSVKGSFLGHRLTFVPWGEGEWRALAPVAVTTEPGDHDLVIRLGEKRRDVRPVTVAAPDFPESRLSVDPRFTKPPKAAQKRIARDRRRIQAAWKKGTAERLWRAPFVPALTSRRTGEYGTRRTFNGVVKSRHLGLDQDGAVGDPVGAIGAGRVVLAEDLYYSGGTVFLDHGGGLFSVYFHLSAIDVAPGDRLTAGQLLGKVGATGRVTGPHLHLGVKLKGVYVSPERLLALELGPDPLAEPEPAATATLEE